MRKSLQPWRPWLPGAEARTMVFSPGLVGQLSLSSDHACGVVEDQVLPAELAGLTEPGSAVLAFWQPRSRRRGWPR
jgi:hypothetical protein